LSSALSPPPQIPRGPADAGTPRGFALATRLAHAHLSFFSVTFTPPFPLGCSNHYHLDLELGDCVTLMDVVRM
jgi:hypothetical protein